MKTSNCFLPRVSSALSLLGVVVGSGMATFSAPALAAPADSAAPKTRWTVAQDGSGDFKTLQEVIAALPDKSPNPLVVHIKPGIYSGQITLAKEKTNVVFQGENAATTILSWNRNVNDPIPEGVDKFNPGLIVRADSFRAANLTIENTAGDRGQALAVRVDGDRAVFENCRLLGWQDTLMVNNGRQLFKNCHIEGRVDFIYGSGTAVFDGCEIRSKNGGYITAASTPAEKPFGFVFLGCKLTGDPNPWIDPATGQPNPKSRVGALAYLGRPWRPYGSVAFINSQMGDHIRPEGWHNWGKVENEATARYFEYGSRTLDTKLPDGTVVKGKTLDVSRRVPWAKQLTAQEAAKYSLANILGGDGEGNLFSEKQTLLIVATPVVTNPAPPNTTGILTAKELGIEGTHAQLENQGENIGYWNNTDTKLGWKANLQPGTYGVALTYSLDPAQIGSEIQVSVGGQNFKLTPPATRGWGDYQTLLLGSAEIRVGITPIVVSALSQKQDFIVNLRGVTLSKK